LRERIVLERVAIPREGDVFRLVDQLTKHEPVHVIDAEVETSEQVREWVVDIHAARRSRIESHLELHEALNELLASEYGRSEWLFAFWSKPLLFSVAARKAWVEPDLRPLPF